MNQYVCQAMNSASDKKLIKIGISFYSTFIVHSL